MARMRRVSIVGCSGAGKSTLAAQVAERLGAAHVELDALFHQPGWTETPAEEFRAEITRRIAADAWVVDGNYRRYARDLVWSAADTVIWLDLPRFVVLRSVLGRTLRRIIRREELWNGNRERWSNFFDPRPGNNVVLWSWTRHPVYAKQMRAALDDPQYSHLHFIRLRSRQEVADWLANQPEPALE
jgi:adenylate kinase family enzyme